MIKWIRCDFHYRAIAMVSMIQTQTKLFCLFFLFFHCFISSSVCQSGNPQNIQTFFPSTIPPTPASSPPASPPPSSPPGDGVVKSSPSPTSKKAIFTAVGATAAATLVVAPAVFFLCTKCMYARRRQQREPRDVNLFATRAPAATKESEFVSFEGNIKGLIVDVNGLDVLYRKKLEGSRKHNSFKREALDRGNNGRKSFARGRLSTSYSQVHPDIALGSPPRDTVFAQAPPRSPYSSSTSSSSLSPPPPPPSPPPPVPKRNSPPLPLPPPLPPMPALVSSPTSPPPPPPPMPALVASTSPPPPPPSPLVPKRNQAPPPPPPPRPGAPVPLRTQAIPKKEKGEAEAEGSTSGEGGDGAGNDQVKMKPLHWEKVNVNTDHSMVWNKIEKGSFRYNGDMMEAIFGYVATNRRSPKESSSIGKNKAAGGSNQSAKTFILEGRRSQNIAIILRSLSVPGDVSIDRLLEGKGLISDTLEKLARIAPTEEEASQILAFNGDPSRLADAESFLYYLLKAVPSAFTRVNAMLFRLSYYSEIPQLKESLQMIESACNELRNRGIFLKLLEAILKAGNHLNAGTSRGNAKAFNLTTLLKLSDYKSSDGRTTLLHFVVREVVRNEGRRCVISQNNSLTRSNSPGRNTNITSSTQTTQESTSKEEREREFIKLGLPVVGGLSSEFSNVKKAASIDHDTLMNTIASVTSRLSETRKLVIQCETDGGSFVKEMKDFIEAAEGELKDVKEEETRVMNIVKKTTQYYQSGAPKDKLSLQLFIIVKDFLGMVDQACIEIARGLQQRKPPGTGNAASSSSSPPSLPPSSPPDVLRTRVTFPRLPQHFLSNRSSRSDSDDES